MSLATKQQTLRDAEILQADLHSLVTKVRWLTENGCFPPDKEPNWIALADQQDQQLLRLDATVWGLRKLTEKDAAQ